MINQRSLSPLALWWKSTRRHRGWCGSLSQGGVTIPYFSKHQNNLEFSVLLLRSVFQQTWQLLGREWSVPAKWEGFLQGETFFLQKLIFSAKDILNDPETMAFTGELSKLCWGIVTSDQVRLIIIFDYHHETKVESYLQRWWLLQLSTMMERLREMFHLGRTSTKYQIYRVFFFNWPSPEFEVLAGK